MKTISVMVAGNTSPSIEKKFNSKKHWYHKYLSKFDIDINFIDIFSNEYTSNSLDADAWIITGSECSVYDHYKWLASFKKLLKNAIISKKPILGICFGHQLLAEVLGGTVEKNPLGWEVGYSQISLTTMGMKSELFNDFEDDFFAAETHQDTVIKLPLNSNLLAENSMGIQAFEYKKRIWGVQFHPEFDNSIMDAYIDMRIQNGIKVLYQQSKDIEKSHMIFNNFIKLI